MAGKLGELIRFIGKYNEAIKCQLEVRRQDLHLVKPMHSTDIQFCISEMAMQVRTRNKRILSSASYYCIIADEWSCRYSNKEYCSTSLRIVTDKLKCDTIFLGFTNIPNTRAENVTSAIMYAIQRDEPQVDLNKCTAQMYDGAIVM